MAMVFVAKNHLTCRDTPVDTQSRIHQLNAAVSLRMVELVTFVLEDCHLTEHGKTVRETTVNKNLSFVIRTDLDTLVLTICGRARTDIHNHVEHPPLHAADKFSLGKRRTLEMEPTDNAIVGFGFVVLNEVDRMAQQRHDLFIKVPLGETFEKVSPCIAENARFNNQDAFKSGLPDNHFRFSSSITFSKYCPY